MQNSLNKEGNIVEFTSKTADSFKGVSVPSELSAQAKLNISIDAPKSAQITPLKSKTISVVKKDGTKEVFDSSKIVNAVKKSATRALVELSEEDLKNICDFVNNNIIKSNKENVSITEMHNFVEGALEHLYPSVAASYRN